MAEKNKMAKLLKFGTDKFGSIFNVLSSREIKLTLNEYLFNSFKKGVYEKFPIDINNLDYKEYMLVCT